jgi:hypothetical protein
MFRVPYAIAVRAAASIAGLGLAACATEPPRHAEVVTMKAGQRTPAASPPPGTVWRLEEHDLARLSPKPVVPAPPPPNWPPPPRPNEPAPYY